MRPITTAYADPLELVWLHAADRMGMRIARSSAVNASWDGAGVLTLGTPETLDADDSLAQMILHEACHALCEGPESLGKLDWGLPYEGAEHRVHEHACLRLQAALADRYGLRRFFASTTMFRPYYDALPADPLAAGDDPAIERAREALRRADTGPWGAALDDALRRTAAIAKALEGVATPASVWNKADARTN